MRDFTQLSKEVSYALRQAPWEYELEMDEESCNFSSKGTTSSRRWH